MEIITINKQDYTIYQPKMTAQGKGDVEERVTAIEQPTALVITLDINKAIETLYPMFGGAIIPASVLAVGLGGLLLMVLAMALLR